MMRSCRTIFNTCPYDDGLPVDNMEAGRPLQERHLPFDADLVPLKPGQAIAIDTHLPVHEVNELPQDIKPGVYLLVVHLPMIASMLDSRERRVGASCLSPVG